MTFRNRELETENRDLRNRVQVLESSRRRALEILDELRQRVLDARVPESGLLRVLDELRRVILGVNGGAA